MQSEKKISILKKVMEENLIGKRSLRTPNMSDKRDCVVRGTIYCNIIIIEQDTKKNTTIHDTKYIHLTYLNNTF